MISKRTITSSLLSLCVTAGSLHAAGPPAPDAGSPATGIVRVKSASFTEDSREGVIRIIDPDAGLQPDGNTGHVRVTDDGVVRLRDYVREHEPGETLVEKRPPAAFPAGLAIPLPAIPAPVTADTQVTRGATHDEDLLPEATTPPSSDVVWDLKPSRFAEEAIPLPEGQSGSEDVSTTIEPDHRQPAPWVAVGDRSSSANANAEDMDSEADMPAEAVADTEFRTPVDSTAGGPDGFDSIPLPPIQAWVEVDASDLEVASAAPGDKQTGSETWNPTDRSRQSMKLAESRPSRSPSPRLPVPPSPSFRLSQNSGDDRNSPAEPPEALPMQVPNDRPAPSRDELRSKRIAELHRPMTDVRIGAVSDPDAEPENAAQAEIGDYPPILVWGGSWAETKPIRYAVPFTHQPLYFEERNLERCGHGHGFFQTTLSAGAFLGNTILLPFHIGSKHPKDCFVSLGDCPTGHCYSPNCEVLEGEGLLPMALQTAAVVGVVFLLL